MAGLFALWPLGSPLFRPWQLISYAFLHGNLVHIFFNMFALFMFGRALETYWGGRRLVMFYLVCVLTAALTQLLVQSGSGAQEEVIGASGGVFGVLLAFAWYFTQAAHHPAVPADSDAGVAVRDRVRAARAVLRRDRPTAGSGAFRPPGRNARRRAVHPVLADAAAASVPSSRAER